MGLCELTILVTRLIYIVNVMTTIAIIAHGTFLWQGFVDGPVALPLQRSTHTNIVLGPAAGKGGI